MKQNSKTLALACSHFFFSSFIFSGIKRYNKEPVSKKLLYNLLCSAIRKIFSNALSFLLRISQNPSFFFTSITMHSLSPLSVPCSIFFTPKILPFHTYQLSQKNIRTLAEPYFFSSPTLYSYPVNYDSLASPLFFYFSSFLCFFYSGFSFIHLCFPNSRLYPRSLLCRF